MDGFLLHIVPSNMFEAFAKGDILQVLFFSILFGAGLTMLGKMDNWLLTFERLSKVFFNILSIVMKLAPVGAFGGMTFTIGKYGLSTLIPLGKLMICVYATMALFVLLF